MKKLITSIMLASCALVSAQERFSPLDSAKSQPWSFATAEKKLKFTPLELISVMPTLSSDLEVSVNDSFSFQAGLGLMIPGIKYGSSFESEPPVQLGGYKLRAEGRFYIFRKPSRYLSAELGFRHQIVREEVGIGMEPSTTVNEFGFEQQSFAYFINTDMIFHRFTSSLTMKYGIQKIIARRFVLDMYGGLSIRRSATKSWSDIPEGGTVPMNRMFWGGLGENSMGYLVTPVIGFRLGFVMK